MSAFEKPLFEIVSVKVLLAPPAVTVGEENAFVMCRWTSSVTVVETVLLVFGPVGSVVPFEVTVALFESTTPPFTPWSSVTWTVNVQSAPRASPPVFVQVTSWPEAEQPAPLANVSPLSSVSVTEKPPVLFDGPLLWTVIV